MNEKEKMMDANEQKAVVVTTAHRGVFFGYMHDGPPPKDGIVTLAKARNCLYWDKSILGFIGLATVGPSAKCRVGPAGDSMVLYAVTSIIDASSAAAKAWEASPWSA